MSMGFRQGSRISEENKSKPVPEVIKTFFILNSAEHEIYHAHKY